MFINNNIIMFVHSVIISILCAIMFVLHFWLTIILLSSKTYRKWSNKPPVSNSAPSRLSPQG